MQIRDSNGQGGAQPFRISRRYLHGDEIDRVIAEEHYANGAGPGFPGTTVGTITGETLWTVTDHLGSARDLVDNNGVVRKHVIYDSFGKRSGEVNRDTSGNVLPPLSAAAVDSAFGYTGADWDADIGLTNHGARWYDSATGRWLGQDPIGFEAEDANLYRYVGNQPTTLTDPTGLEEYVVTVRYSFKSSVLDVTPAVKNEVTRILQQAFNTYARAEHTLTVRFHTVGSQFEYDNVPAGVGSKFGGGYGFDVKIHEAPGLKNLGAGKVAQGSNFRAGIEPKKFAREVRSGVNADKALAAVIVHELYFHGCYKDYTLQKPHLSATGFIDSARSTIRGNLSPEAAKLIIESMGAD